MADKKITDNDHPRPTGSGGGMEAWMAKAVPPSQRIGRARPMGMRVR
jgi:hypothetical protein